MFLMLAVISVILDMWWQNKATTLQVEPRFIYLLMHENAKLDPFKCDTWGLLSSIFEFSDYPLKILTYSLKKKVRLRYVNELFLSFFGLETELNSLSKRPIHPAAVEFLQTTTSCFPVHSIQVSFVPPVSVDLASLPGLGCNRLISAEDSLMNKSPLRCLSECSYSQCTQ